MKRKLISVLLCLSTAMAMLTGCGNESDKTSSQDKDTPKAESGKDDAEALDGEEGKVLNIYCWNDEFKNCLEGYAADLVPDDVAVNWVITPSEENAYLNKLDEALLAQQGAAADYKIDIFLIEADYALRYVNADCSLDVINDLGLTESDIADQYKYTQEIVTDSNKVLKAVSWQATPGLFAYRRSIAKDVLGTDNPEEVQEALSNWDNFDKVAKQAADKGYKMLSGYDDSYRAFSNNVSVPWIGAQNTIEVDDNLMRWVDQTKIYADNEYSNKTSLFDEGWIADQGPEGNVFGFFYSTWGINFTLLKNALKTPEEEGGKLEVGNGIYGDYAVCQGPESYYWGGTWICGAVGTDNTSLVKDIMYRLTCDKDTMKKITEDTQDYTNNQKAMEELASGDYASDFLGGQNHIKNFAEAAPKIDMSNVTSYDQGLNECFQGAFKEYFAGDIDKEGALNNFYKMAVERYPDLFYIDKEGPLRDFYKMAAERYPDLFLR